MKGDLLIMQYSLPANLPKSTIHRYFYVIEKDYVKYLILINKLGNYITFQQFYKMYQLLNPDVAISYAEKKANKIIKDLAENKFISIESMNRNKYFYLRTPALAFCTNDYKTAPRLNHLKSVANNKFLTSLMKVEYYITTKNIISSSTLFNHLKIITKKIYEIVNKDSSLDYNLQDIEYILTLNHIKDIQACVSKYPEYNLLRIIWLDLYNIYSKLQLQGQTILQQPTVYKLYKSGRQLRLHYAPNIVIFDTHDTNYYYNKITSLFNQFNNISTNELNNINDHFMKNKTLGYEGYNHLCYTLTLVGYNETVLNQKIDSINKYIADNVNNPILGKANYIYLDISKYINHSIRKYESFEAIDDFLDSKISNYSKK